MHFDAGHILVINLQSARRFLQTETGEREGERGEQHEAAGDHRDGDDGIRRVLFHGVLC